MLSSAPVVAQLEELDLSLGLLTDTGGRALLEGQPLTHLKRLNLHHHFLTEPVRAALRAALEPFGVDLDLSEPQDPEDEWRYVSIGE
ncbi:hypothetical protein [Streptomyces calidiresistens]|uniref:Leucine-rich repeat domain-containing protein n=1 Tax=Streptomyces calidiresistens TaxID=1485586 RepID=A0A7W3XZ81_9ACTN|nr:hypothetical protein [Streptomyces calidiresistens]MBB0232566.1 hypothetical protein [Streptomyces calidiresistens]